MTDSFLPSGGIDSPRKDFSHLSSQTISPLSGVPRSHPMNEYFPPSHITHQSTPSPKSYIPSQTQQSHVQPISPPKTRSPSAENTSAALIEDWRAYTTKLRSQAEGERAHMVADRARADEVMAEERRLWDQEKAWYIARIAELEEQLKKANPDKKIITTNAPLIDSRPQMHSHVGAIPGIGSGSMSASSSREGSSARAVPQESGRDPEGNAIWAPAAHNPSRTFESSESNDLRMSSITTPNESAIRLADKELTPSDFIRSPPSIADLEPIRESPPDSIDISHIRSDLEGVAIKTSAVSPTFVANVISPSSRSPSKLSPSARPSRPRGDVTNQTSPPRSVTDDSKHPSLEVASAPENRRLTMHAGHTPNHSVSLKLPWATDEDEVHDSQNATPRQTKPEHIHRPSVAPGSDALAPGVDEDDGDRALSGPLGLTNNAVHDDPFLTALTEKLAEAQKSLPSSPGADSVSSHDSNRAPADDEDKDEDEGPILKIKSSFNFGRPLGRM